MLQNRTCHQNNSNLWQELFFNWAAYLKYWLPEKHMGKRLKLDWNHFTPPPPNPQDIRGKWGLQHHSSCGKTTFHNFKLGVVVRTLVVRVCVVASPVALCDASGGCLVADALVGSRRPPIRGVCVMPLRSAWGTVSLSLGVHSPPWMAVMGSGSALAVVWWIMMRVFLSLPAAIKSRQIIHNWGMLDQVWCSNAGGQPLERADAIMKY